MKASEMTNVQIADYILSLQSDVDGFPFNSNEIIKEAAARLRRPTPVDDDLLKMARDIDKLRAKLKVAEDALTELQDRCVASVHDGTIDPYEALSLKLYNSEMKDPRGVKFTDQFNSDLAFYLKNRKKKGEL